MPALRIVVFGQVQGVGFRAFTRDLADELDVSGEVWNRRDGAVEMLVGHPSDAVLQSFMERLKRGPGVVRDMSREPLALDVPAGFVVGPSR